MQLREAAIGVADLAMGLSAVVLLWFGRMVWQMREDLRDFISAQNTWNERINTTLFGPNGTNGMYGDHTRIKRKVLEGDSHDEVV